MSASTCYIALLRAINVGGSKVVAMAQLVRMAEELGMKEVTSLLQSGNLMLVTEGTTPAALERRLEQAAQQRLGLSITFIVRKDTEVRSIIADNPFPDIAKADPSHLVVVFLKEAPPLARVKALQASITGPEQIRAEGRQLYVTYPAGIGRSRLTNAVIEGTLGTSGTARNWNTIHKLFLSACSRTAAS